MIVLSRSKNAATRPPATAPASGVPCSDASPAPRPPPSPAALAGGAEMPPVSFASLLTEPAYEGTRPRVLVMRPDDPSRQRRSSGGCARSHATLVALTVCKRPLERATVVTSGIAGQVQSDPPGLNR